MSYTCLKAVKTALKIDFMPSRRNMSPIRLTVALGILPASSYTNHGMERSSVLKPISL